MAKTIYDIAREANVGIGTVSRVFNNHPSVSEETKRKVLRVARKFKYQPHPYARGLARRRTNTILAVVPYVSSFFFVEILQSVQTLLHEEDCDLVLHGIASPSHLSQSLRRVGSRGRFDGVLFFSLRLPEEFYDETAQLKIPLVLVDTEDPRVDSFSVNNVEGSTLATEHFIRRGHRNIAIVTANLESKPARDRLTGYRAALEKHGLPYQQRLVFSATSPKLDGFTREEGYALGAKLLSQRGPEPTAIVVSSDIQALGVREAVVGSGRSCPDDIEIMGFDDIELARHVDLSTMRQPLDQMGKLATQRLFERISNPDLPVVHRTFVPELVLRGTTLSIDLHAHRAAYSSTISTTAES